MCSGRDATQVERDSWQQQHSRAQTTAASVGVEVGSLRHQLTAAQATQAQAARELRQQTRMVEELTELAADATVYAMDLVANGAPQQRVIPGTSPVSANPLCKGERESHSTFLVSL
jgi:hypothetical protein